MESSREMYVKDMEKLALELQRTPALLKYIDLQKLQKQLAEYGSEIDLGPLLNGN